MGDSGGYCGYDPVLPPPPRIGRPKRDRAKVKAGRRAARRR